jgi:hypothetical protein
MSYTRQIGHAQWERIYACLSEYSEIYVKNEEDYSRFVEAVFWMVRRGKAHGYIFLAVIRCMD